MGSLAYRSQYLCGDKEHKCGPWIQAGCRIVLPAETASAIWNTKGVSTCSGDPMARFWARLRSQVRTVAKLMGGHATLEVVVEFRLHRFGISSLYRCGVRSSLSIAVYALSIRLAMR